MVLKDGGLQATNLNEKCICRLNFSRCGGSFNRCIFFEENNLLMKEKLILLLITLVNLSSIVVFITHY